MRSVPPQRTMKHAFYPGEETSIAGGGASGRVQHGNISVVITARALVQEARQCSK